MSRNPLSRRIVLTVLALTAPGCGLLAGFQSISGRGLGGSGGGAGGASPIADAGVDADGGVYTDGGVYADGGDAGSPAYTCLWSETFGTDDGQRVGALMLDGANVWVTGNYNGPIVFGDGGPLATGPENIFVVELDSDGKVQTHKGFVSNIAAPLGSGTVARAGLAPNGTGFYLTGSFAGDIELGCATYEQQIYNDAGVARFVAAFDDQANCSVAQEYNPTGTDYATGVASTSAHVIGAGVTNYQYTLSMGVYSPTTLALTPNEFAGDNSLAMKIAPRALAVLNAAVFVGGGLTGTINMNDGVVLASNPTTATDAFLAGFDSSNIAFPMIWGARYGDDAGASADTRSILALAAGQVSAGGGSTVSALYATGYHDGAINFGGTELPSQGGKDVFLARFDPADGGVGFAKSFGSQSDQSGTAIAIAPDTTTLFLAGDFQGTLDFGGGASVQNDDLTSHVFIARLDPSGTAMDVHTFGPSGTPGSTQSIDALGVLASGSTTQIVIAGSLTGQLDLGCGPLDGGAAGRIFVAKLQAPPIP